MDDNHIIEDRMNIPQNEMFQMFGEPVAADVDVLAVIVHVKQKIMERNGVVLEREVVVWP